MYMYLIAIFQYSGNLYKYIQVRSLLHNRFHEYYVDCQIMI